MHIQHRWWTVLVATMLGGLVGVTAMAAAGKYAQDKGITPWACP